MLKLGTTGVSTTYKKAYLGNDLVYDGYAGIKTTPNSNNYTLNNSAEGKNKGTIKIGNGPELKQIVPTGKNIFDKDSATYVNKTIKNANGEETSSDVSGYLTSYISVNENTVYTIQGRIKPDTGNVAGIYYYDSSKNWISKQTISHNIQLPYTFTTPVDCEYIQFQYTIANYDANTVMIEPGSIASNYEPFTNGTIAPNPNYPQSITVVEGESSIEIGGKNLFDGNATPIKSNSITVSFSNNILSITNPSTTANRSAGYFIRIQCNKQITISHGDKIITTGNNLYTRYALYKDKPTSITFSTGTTFTDEVTINTENYNYLLVLFAAGNGAAGTIANVQVEYGIKTAYKPHKGQSYSLTLPNGIFLGSIDTASNYIYGTKNNWILHQELDKIILNGTESWTRARSSTTNVDFSSPIALMKATNAYAVEQAGIRSDLFIPISYTDYYYGRAEGIARFKSSSGTQAASNSIFISISQSRLTDDTAPAFKSWLSENNLTLYYLLENSININITDTTLITQLNNIADNLQTYKNQTVVFTSSENLEPNIQFNYRAK